jgi:hypothetical protein
MALATVAGCMKTGPGELASCKSQVSDLERENVALKEKLAATQRTIESQNARIEALATVPADRMTMLVAVERVELARLTGGYDDPRDGVDDGIVAYVQPMDRDGDVIKATGSIEVKVYDLTGTIPVVVGEATVPVEESLKSWYGKLWTQHFTVRVPFATKPASTDVTVRVRYVELLTGKAFVAQKACTVNFDPRTATQPSQPVREVGQPES